ncbi:MAG: tRNA (adenosine(37)-N6)-threonylcarbamoyltransferase complex dimerization subunit type 1 TsaB [Phycisphaerae bacterium]|nr:tRNA (adenosine(37)-N6)-threonylcarbamoyltransferase complex dimerization subunit type 1 TsaB [Phycisphaerae bacterium]MDW8261652.1 tRNA (adenosine(37)-N6)-threonylcarbamoyltransferase complex dimerization subunit type 1 TsaB [Phycisphaerales bacterium]
MPRAIAIETSGRAGSIALAAEGKLLVEESFAHGLAHAAGVLPMIDRLVRVQGWSPEDLEQVYLSIGPGSFTGLRIAVTIAKALAFSLGVKVVAVPTVRVLIENAPQEAQRGIIVLDAKRGQVFTAAFERSGINQPWRELEAPQVDTLENIIGRLVKPVHLIGEGITYHRQCIPKTPDVVVTEPDRWRARAAVVARIGAEMAGRGEFADPWTLQPLYIRLPEAEEKWRKTHGQ